VTEHIKKKEKERETQLVTSSSKYFGMPPALLQRWPRAQQTPQLLLTAVLGLLSSNANNICTMSRTDTLLQKNSRVTVEPWAPRINTFISGTKHGWKWLSKAVSTGPAHTAVLQCVFQSLWSPG